MQCRSALTRVDARRTGELPDHERNLLEEHLRVCRSCEESAEDVDSLAGAVRALSVSPPRSCRDALCDRFDLVEVDGHDVWVAFTDNGLSMIHSGGSEDAFRGRYGERFDRELTRASLPDKLRRQVHGALSGEGAGKAAVDLRALTEFERTVLEVLTRIPRGEVRSYSWVAQQAGRPSAVRAVGNICARNVVPFVVPCHRVVPTTGGIGNYAFGSPMKRELLSREGAPVEEIERLAREGVRFTGSKTTKIFCNPTCKDARRTRDENRIYFHDAGEAFDRGFRPCLRCQPAAA